MNMSMCEVPVHPVEFLTEADVALLPELPMTQDTDGTYYCDGESTQETTTGAQLFDGVMEKGGILATGVNNDAKDRIRCVNYIRVIPGDTYILSWNDTSSCYPRFYSEIEDCISMTTVKNRVAFTIPDNAYKMRIQFVSDNYKEIETEDITLLVMLNAGSTALPYEPYTGGIPSPNPDYPQPIINTYPAGTYRAICGDKAYKIVLDDDLRNIPGAADRVRIDARRGCMWVERNVFLFQPSNSARRYANYDKNGFYAWVTYDNKLLVGKDSNYLGNYGLSDKFLCSYSMVLEKLNSFRSWFSNRALYFSLNTDDSQIASEIINSSTFLLAAKPTTHQSVPTLLTTIEPTKSLTIENTVNAPTEVRVRGDSWQGSTTGAQLFPFSGTVDNVNFTATIEKNEITITSKVSSSGILLISLDIDVKAGETYIFMAEYNKGLANIDVFRPDGTRENVVPKNTPFTAKEGYTYKAKIYLNVSGSTVGIGDTRTYRNVMVNAGSTPLPWEPYTGNAPSPSPEYPQDIISTTGILKSTNNSLGGRDKLRESQIAIPELRAIPGTDVRDELVVYEDGSGKIVRRVGKRVYDGTETVNMTGYKKTYIIAQSDADYNAIVASTHFAYNSVAFCDTSTFVSISSYSKSVVFSVPDFSDEEKNPEILKSFLKEQYDNGTPVIVFYVLAAPTEEPLTAAEVQGIIRTHQYHTEIGFEGLDEHLEPEVEVKCKVLGR